MPGGRTAFTPCVAGVYAAAGHRDRALQELDDALDPDDSTSEAIGDWHYWVSQDYLF